MSDSPIHNAVSDDPKGFNTRPFRMSAAILSAVVGSVTLLGWTLDVPSLTTLGVGLDDPVKISTGVGFLFASIASFAWLIERVGSRTSFLVRICAAAVVLILGLGSLLIRMFESAEMRLSPDASAFRMSLNTALALTALGCSWILGGPASRPHPVTPRIAWCSQLAAILALTIGYVAIIGHAYSASLLYGFSRDVNMALPSAITVFGLGVGSFFRFELAGAAGEVVNASVGGRLIRRVVLLAAVVIPLIGALRLFAQDRALVDTRLGAALFAASNVLLLASGMWVSGRRLNQVAASERFVRNALSDQAALLESRVRERTKDLQTSESRFRLLADAAPVLIFLVDSDLRIESVNAMTAAFFGDASKAVDDEWKLAVHPEDLTQLQERARQASLTKTAFSLQLRLRRHDGEYRWMEARGVPRLDSQDRVIGFIGICLDITDAQLAREELSRALDSVEQALGRERILRREIDHRVRNNISSLLGLTAFYESSVRSQPQALAVTGALRGKIRAMKEVHDLVVRSGGGLVDVQHLWNRLLSAMVADDLRTRIRVQMPSLPPVKANQASALAMVLQELLANSAKHGALGLQDGVLDIVWSPSGDQCGLAWNETFTAGPSAPIPADESGLGLELIRGLVVSDLRGTCEFRAEPGAWSCRIDMKLV